MIVFVGVMSSIAADAGYLVLVPLAAAAFHSMGRHPLAGLAAGFSGVAAVFLVNVFVTPTDALLVEVTNDAIRTVNPAAQINVVGNLFFMIASSIVMAILCTLITEKYVEPRPGPYTGGLPVEETEGLSGSEQLGLKYAGRAALGFLVVIVLLTAPPIPFGILRNQETGGIMAGSPFMSGLIVLISLLFLVVGYAYGRGAGTIANATAAIGLVVKTWSNLSGMIFLLFVIANFIAFFDFTNLATVLAVNLADFLQTLPIGAGGYIVLFVVTVAIIDIILTGALAEMGDPGPGFHPALHAARRRSGSGDGRLPRVGDSPMNVITPLNVYLAVMVGFAQKYQKDAGIGTIVALMLPYTGVLLVGLDADARRLVPRRPAARARLTAFPEPHSGGCIMSDLEKVLAHIDGDFDNAIGRLFATLRLKSISTDPAYAAECRACAEWHARDLVDIGFDATVRDTPGHPMVVCHLEGGLRPLGAVLRSLRRAAGRSDRALGQRPLRAHDRDAARRLQGDPRPGHRRRQGPAHDLRRGLSRLEDRHRQPADPGHGSARGRRGIRRRQPAALS